MPAAILMTRWQHFLAAIEIRKSKIEITIVRPDRLPDAEVTKVLRAAPEAHLVYRAFMQLLEDAEREAVHDVAEGCWNKLTMAMHAGGARYLKAVREDILNRRQRKKAAGQ